MTKYNKAMTVNKHDSMCSPCQPVSISAVTKHGESVALLVARRTNNRKVVGSMPANVVCITVLTGNRLG